MLAKGTAACCYRCYFRFNLPIAFASVVPKASTPTMSDSITTSFTVISSSEVTRATVVIPAGFGTRFVGYYYLLHFLRLLSSICRMQGDSPESLSLKVASFTALSYATICVPYLAFL